jgi:hypothetical protein
MRADLWIKDFQLEGIRNVIMDGDFSSILAHLPAYPGRYTNSAFSLHCHVTQCLKLTCRPLSAPARFPGRHMDGASIRLALA